MNNENQQQINANHQDFLTQLEQLAEQAASAQAQIASEAAKHEFRVRFNHYLQEKMAIAASETYSEVLQEVQNFINQFAQSAATRALDVESNTANKFKDLKQIYPNLLVFLKLYQSKEISNLIC